MRESLLPQLAGDIAAHLAVEEQLCDPIVRRVLQTDALARHAAAQHPIARSSLERVLEVRSNDEAFAIAIRELRAAVEMHAEEQEEWLFPRLEKALEPEVMRSLAYSMLRLYHTKVELGYVRAAARAPGAGEEQPGEPATPR
jgi:hypothetical protein